jgi:hypothetical protein
MREEEYQAAIAALREDYRTAAGIADDMRFRLRAAIAEVVEVDGIGSPEHLRLRYALCGEGDGCPTEEAFLKVMTHDEESRKGDTA